MRTRSAVVTSEDTTTQEKTEKQQNKGSATDAKENNGGSKSVGEAQQAMSPDPSRAKSPSSDGNSESTDEKSNPTSIPEIYIEEATKESSRSPESACEVQQGKASENRVNDDNASIAEAENDCIEAMKNQNVSKETVREDELHDTKANDSEPIGHGGNVKDTNATVGEARANKKKQDRPRKQKSLEEKSSPSESLATALPGRTPFTSAFPFPAFPPNPATLLSGHLQSDFARSLSQQFYNNLSLLASQAMLNVKQEPAENSYQGYDATSDRATPVSAHNLPIPPRTASHSSDASGHSYDAAFPKKENGHRLSPEYSPAHSGGSDTLLQRPPSGLSPKSLAEQLRNNDSASMVVSRQQKFTGRNPAYKQLSYPMSGGESPPPVFTALPKPTPESFASGSDVPPSTSSNTTSSPSLHHFTTRYTVETPADPSRLGVELVLDHDNDEPVIEVECGGNRGLLYVNKLCQGSKGQSIHFNDEWLTPNEFQFISGRETAKDWKRSIRHCGKSLKTLMTKGILQVHPPVCECNQCRGLHSGSKLLVGKKLQHKDANNNSKKIRNSPPPYLPEGKLSASDMMTKHGYEGGLSSIISQLHKANGFDTAAESSETLDLSTKPHHRAENSSPESHSRKRSRNDSPSDSRKEQDSAENGHSSPQPKRPYSRQSDFHQYDGQAPVPASYPFPTTEEHYRRMLALFNRSLSPDEHQRQLYNLAAESLPIHPDYAALQNPLQLEAFYERAKRKYGTKGRPNDAENHGDASALAYDLTRKSRQKSSDISGRKSGYSYPYAQSKIPGSKHDKYRKPDRVSTAANSADIRRYHRSEHMGAEAQKYIALDGRSRDQRDDARWSNKTPDASYRRQDQSMIDLNSSGSSSSGHLPDWYSKHPSWSTERDQNGRKQSDWRSHDSKTSPGRRASGSFHGFYPDNHIILDRIPISKNPVTTLHHRPPAKYAANDDPTYPPNDRTHFSSPKGAHRHQNRTPSSAGNRQDPHQTPVSEKDVKGSRMPMLDLQKHAVPMVSLTYSKRNGDDAYHGSQSEGARVRLSNTSEEGIKDEGLDSSPRRQSSSAPPPHLSPRDASKIRRPTSAQDDSERGILFASRRRPVSPLSIQKLHNGHVSPDTITSSIAQSQIAAEHHVISKYDNYMKRRRDEIQGAFEDMVTWSANDVCDFVRKIAPCFEDHEEEFRKLEIDGEGLPLLTERHLMDLLGMKLGQALKVVARVRRTLKIYPESLECCHHPFISEPSPHARPPAAKSPKLPEDTRGCESAEEVAPEVNADNGKADDKIDENNNNDA